jgi:Na+/H+ antiporter NhaC
MRREFGPMLTAERRAKRGLVSRPGARPMVSDAMTRVTPKEGIPHRWWNGLVPLVAVVAVTIAMLWRSGNASLETPYGMSGFFSLAALRDVIAEAESTKAIAGGAWTGFFLAAAMMLVQRILTPLEIVRAAFSSTRALFFAIVILILAWCIGGVCSDLGTAHYLVALFRKTISPLIYPFVLFILSCLVSFSTGSSWSTMAIILPNSVVLAFLLGETSPIGPFGLTVISIGAVLEGSIFGDHCSPLSDTTILSSVSSATDHIDHVRTQIPYAMTSMVVALLCGYLPAARGVPAPISLASGIAVLILILRFVGRNPEADQLT